MRETDTKGVVTNTVGMCIILHIPISTAAAAYLIRHPWFRSVLVAVRSLRGIQKGGVADRFFRAICFGHVQQHWPVQHRKEWKGV